MWGFSNVAEADCIIIAVAHKEFKEIGLEKLNSIFKNVPQDEKVLIDVKGIYEIEDVKKVGFTYWRL